MNSWSQSMAVAPIAVGLLIVAACSSPGNEPQTVSTVLPEPPGPGPAPLVSEGALFTDITGWSGVTAVGTEDGVSIIDADRDGIDDVIIPFDGRVIVLRNRGDGSFYPLWANDVTEPANILYVLDWNHDGIDDIMSMSLEGEDLLIGRGDGRFELDPEGFLPRSDDRGLSSVATFGDLNGDGYMDVYLGRLIDDGDSGPGGPIEPEDCDDIAGGGGDDGGEFQGIVFEDPPGRDRLLLGGPDGPTEVSAPEAPEIELYTQCATIYDFDQDGALDLVVATEGARADAAWRGDGQGGLQRYSLFPDGQISSGMGFDLADIDGDSDFDLYLSDDGGQGDHLLLWNGERYENGTEAGGLLEDTAWMSAWGMGFFDFDHDGDRDLFVANGIATGPCPGGAQENLLFFNDGTGRFTRQMPSAPSALDVVRNSRGAAFSDIDRDGDIDIIVKNVDGPPTVLRNDMAKRGAWLQIRLVHPTLSPVVGATITLRAGDQTLMHHVIGTPSYGASSSHWIHFGLGLVDEVTDVRVRWPDGSITTLDTVSARQFITIDKSASR